MIDSYYFPQVWSKTPFIEGDTTSEYFPYDMAKSGKRKVNSIDLKTPFVIETPRKSIPVESICVTKEYGQYVIQLLDEPEGEVQLDISISRELVNLLNFAMNKYEEVSPDE